MNEQEIMLTSILDCRRVDLYTQKCVLSAEQEVEFERMKFRFAQGEPLQVIVGETEFCGLKFFINKHVLIPRPETEMMVGFFSDWMAAQGKEAQPFHILDIGTGSGCIAVSLAKRFPALTCCAVDISEDALLVAKKNAKQHSVDGQIVFFGHGIESFWSQCSPQSFDLIISNPPYIPQDALATLPRNVRREPRIAFDGGGDGLRFYRDFILHAPCVLKSSGILMCEFWDGQDSAIKAMFDQKWGVDFFQDLSGVNRFFMAQYC